MLTHTLDNFWAYYISGAIYTEQQMTKRTSQLFWSSFLKFLSQKLLPEHKIQQLFPLTAFLQEANNFPTPGGPSKASLSNPWLLLSREIVDTNCWEFITTYIRVLKKTCNFKSSSFYDFNHIGYSKHRDSRKLSTGLSCFIRIRWGQCTVPPSDWFQSTDFIFWNPHQHLQWNFQKKLLVTLVNTSLKIMYLCSLGLLSIMKTNLRGVTCRYEIQQTYITFYVFYFSKNKQGTGEVWLGQKYRSNEDRHW